MKQHEAAEPTPDHPLAPDLRPVEGSDADHEIAKLAKALGHPARVAIVRRLRLSGRASCGDLVSETGLAQSTVSEHLRLLREAGLVSTDRANGGDYQVDVHRVRRLKALVGSL